MNDFQSVDSGSGLLKNSYPASSSQKEALVRRRRKLAEINLTGDSEVDVVLDKEEEQKKKKEK